MLPVDEVVLRVLLVWGGCLLVAVVALLWTRVAAGNVLDEDATDLARVRYDHPLTITGDRPHA